MTDSIQSRLDGLYLRYLFTVGLASDTSDFANQVRNAVNAVKESQQFDTFIVKKLFDLLTNYFLSGGSQLQLMMQPFIKTASGWDNHCSVLTIPETDQEAALKHFYGRVRIAVDNTATLPVSANFEMVHSTGTTLIQIGSETPLQTLVKLLDTNRMATTLCYMQSHLKRLPNSRPWQSDDHYTYPEVGAALHKLDLQDGVLKSIYTIVRFRDYDRLKERITAAKWNHNLCNTLEFQWI